MPAGRSPVESPCDHRTGIAATTIAKVGRLPVTLIGLAAKNAILIVEFAAQRMRKGATVFEAAVEGARLRFRPIIMTSLAFVLGVLPLAVSTGAGSASRHSIGTGVIGGMLAATFVAILFVPVFFRLVTRARPVTDTKRTDVVQAPAK